MGKTSLVLNIAQHVGHEDRHDGRASSASRCRRSSCSCACSPPRRASTRTGCAAGSSASATGAGCRRRSARSARRRSSSTTRRRSACSRCARSAGGSKSEHGLHLVIVDYIQLMQGRGRFENRTLELASISRSLKGLAKELQRADRRAVAAQPRAGVALRSPAAAVGPARVGRPRAGRRRRDVHLPRGSCTPTRTQPPTDAQGVAELIIGKQRNGPTGVVKLAFIREFTRFENLAPGYRRDPSRPSRASTSARSSRTTARSSSSSSARAAPGRRRRAARHRRRQGERLRPRRRAGGARARGRRRGPAGVRRHRGRRGAARGRRRAPRSWCSAR